ncbi:MAG TPA: type II toxin-antitoxin system HipA family toxin [Arenimonas sp.]|nr:type II toxin-antitoxin system HipA family toxin [Arenimonas sp.]
MTHTSKTRITKLARYKHVERVEVFLWGELIGAVALDQQYGYYAFAYTPKFIAKGVQPSPLKMPLREEPYLFIDLPVETYKRLPALLSDALPDDFGNALINKYMAERGIGAEQVTEIDRLAYMSNRAMGALVFKPSRGPKRQTTALELGQLVSEARKAVTGSLDDEHANAALRSIIDVGTSAGGARAKAVIAWNRQTNEVRSGQFSVPNGFEHWLLKFDGIGKDNELGATSEYGRIELAYYLMAKKAGIEMMECRLLTENGRSHFMTRRFDREGTETRHHMQTLCAMAHMDYKKKSTNAYSQLFLTMNQLALAYEQREQAFRRMVFNVMSRNCDDHTKNISFLLKENGAWELAPAYDITFAHNPKGEWTNQHLMSVNGKFKDFLQGDLFAEADRFKIGTGMQVINEVRQAISSWPMFAKEAGLSQANIDSIGAQHLLLLR